LFEALRQLSTPVDVVTRLRLDAAPLSPCSIAASETDGSSRKVGKRLPTLKALIDNPYTPGTLSPGKAWSWRLYLQSPSHCRGITLDYLLYLFVGSCSKTLKLSFNRKRFCVQIHRLNLSKFCIGSATRWQLEVTFLEVRAHLGLNSTSMVITSHRPYHPLCSTVLNRDCHCSISSFFSIRLSCQSCLVSEDATDVC